MRSARLLAFAASALVACAFSGPPELDTDGPASRDGLLPLRNTRFDRAWAKPGLDLSHYQRIWLVSEGVAYREAPERPYGASTDAAQEPFKREELETTLILALRQAFFADGAWKLAEAAGPDVLVLRAALVDVVVDAPPEPISVRHDVIVESAGRATIVLELLDSTTREVLVRFVDRAEFEPSSGRMQSNAITNRLEIRRTLEAWAQLARRRLEELRALKLSDSPA
jgi:hypothetical protein